MSNTKTTMFIVAGLVLLTALGNAWVLFFSAIAGLIWLFLAGKPDNPRKVTNLLSAVFAAGCAAALVILVAG